MEMIDHKDNNPLSSISLELIMCFFVFSILCIPLIIAGSVNAQSMGYLVTFHDSITYGEDEGSLYLPSFVFADKPRDEIYVIDGKGRIIIYTSDLFPLHTMGNKSGIEAPQGLTVDAEGNLYVAQAPSKENPRGRISVFSACLKWERDIYFEGFEGADSFLPSRLAVDKNGDIYVISNSFPGVLILGPDGHLIEILIPDEIKKNVTLNNVIIHDSKIYLLSEEAGRIFVYDEERKLLFKFGEKGGSSGKLSRPKAVAVDGIKGRIYVVDYMRHTINVYDGKGNYIFEFGGLGWGEGWFKYPNDIAIDNSGRIFVADLFNNRVQAFNSW